MFHQLFNCQNQMKIDSLLKNFLCVNASFTSSFPPYSLESAFASYYYPNWSFDESLSNCLFSKNTIYSQVVLLSYHKWSLPQYLLLALHPQFLSDYYYPLRICFLQHSFSHHPLMTIILFVLDFVFNCVILDHHHHIATVLLPLKLCPHLH